MYRHIRELREDRDLTQTDVAAILNITQATYSRYENGQVDFPSQALIKLAEYYHVSVDYLLGLTDRP